MSDVAGQSLSLLLGYPSLSAEFLTSYEEKRIKSRKTWEETTKIESIKPNKHESFAVCWEALTVNTWLYQTETYLNLNFLGNIQILLQESSRVSISSTLLKGNAAKWWQLMVQLSQV